MPPPTQHRVDPPNTAIPRSVGPNAAGLAVRQTTVGQRSERRQVSAVGRQPPDGGTGSEGGDPQKPSVPLLSAVLSRSEAPSDLAPKEDWLRLHATDLLDRLQAWASDLDAREAQLNARLSVQDHRERRFRLYQQDVATELAEQKRSIERLRAENKAQARRLAFDSDSVAQ